MGDQHPKLQVGKVVFRLESPSWALQISQIPWSVNTALESQTQALPMEERAGREEGVTCGHSLSSNQHQQHTADLLPLLPQDRPLSWDNAPSPSPREQSSHHSKCHQQQAFNWDFPSVLLEKLFNNFVQYFSSARRGNV